MWLIFAAITLSVASQRAFVVVVVVVYFVSDLVRKLWINPRTVSVVENRRTRTSKLNVMGKC